MRYALCLLLVCGLLLAACGGDDDTETPPAQEGPAQNIVPVDEPTLDPNAPTQAANPTYYNELGTPIPLDQVTPFATAAQGVATFVLPPPGVLATSASEDLEPITGFDYIYFEQQGGPDGIRIVIEVYSDGRVVRDGQPVASASQEEIAAIARMLDEINFFGMQSTFIGPPASDTIYRYRLGVARGSAERAIQAQDGFIPVPLIRLLGAIRALGDL